MNKGMNADQYVASVIAKHAVRSGPGSPAHRTAMRIIPTIKEWAGGHLLGVEFSGSYAKGTAIALGTDVDLFISIDSGIDRSVKEIYWSLFQWSIDHQLRPEPGNVSIRVWCDGVRVDLVPGRQLSAVSRPSSGSQKTLTAEAAEYTQRSQDQLSAVSRPSSASQRILTADDAQEQRAAGRQSSAKACEGKHTIYRRRTDAWMQTDVSEHMRVVGRSGWTDEIRAMKIWRERWRLDWPSFYLELTVLDALKGSLSATQEAGEEAALRSSEAKSHMESSPLTVALKPCSTQRGLAGNMRRALEYVAEDFVRARVVDPANTNNVISDELRTEEKGAIAAAARKALGMSSWESVLW